MIRSIKYLVSVFAALLMFGSISAKADIVVASAGPMSGQYASFGAQLKAGAEMWVKDTNAAGGINGEKVKLVIGDDACDPKQAVAVANKFVSQKVAYVAGHFCSDLQYQLQKFTQRKVFFKFLQLQQIRLLRTKGDQTYSEFVEEMTNKVKLLVNF